MIAPKTLKMLAVMTPALLMTAHGASATVLTFEQNNQGNSAAIDQAY